jgi:hypothetical protein
MVNIVALSDHDLGRKRKMEKNEEYHYLWYRSEEWKME